MILSTDYMNAGSASRAFNHLTFLAEKYDVMDICSEVICDPRFLYWSGSSDPKYHHYGEFGLILHTTEVCDNTLALINANDTLYNAQPRDYKVGLIAAAFHDYGKLFDYVKNAEGEWVGTTHKKMVYHITRSALFFSEMAKKHRLDPTLEEDVLHCILAHHGQRAWGSPVEPVTRVAMAVHLADMASARFFDLETRGKK